MAPSSNVNARRRPEGLAARRVQGDRRYHQPAQPAIGGVSREAGVGDPDAAGRRLPDRGALTQGVASGKTTTAIALGSTLASLRGDRVIAVDANPDLGTLAQRLPRETDSTVRDLLADRNLNRYSDIREHTSQAPSRLEVLASERDPAAAEAFNDEEYRGVLGILQRFYNIIITDCGTGLSNSVMKGVLDTADSIIVVSSPSTAHAARHRPSIGLDAHGFGRLVSSAIVVISSSRPGSPNVDIEQMTEYFSARCRAIRLVGSTITWPRVPTWI